MAIAKFNTICAVVRHISLEDISHVKKMLSTPYHGRSTLHHIKEHST